MKTTEEKAKAYDEALKRAKAMHDVNYTDSYTKANLETIFPELRESEDERMMRVIGLALTDVPEERFTSLGTTLKDCLAYLEKQKEQKPAEVEQNPLVRMLKDKKAITEDIRNGIPTKTIEKERNVKFATPVDVSYTEWSEEDKQCLDTAIAILENLGYDGLADNLKHLRPHSKQEWSEEDEAHRNFILESLEDQIRFCKKNAEGAYYAKQIRTAQNWLKALKPHWKPSEKQIEQKPNFDTHWENGSMVCEQKEQKPAEWSEEDDGVLGQIIIAFHRIANGSEHYFSQDTAKVFEEKLKSLRPSWKPSEEQMKALQWWAYQDDELRSLLNDLKKL